MILTMIRVVSGAVHRIGLVLIITTVMKNSIINRKAPVQ